MKHTDQIKEIIEEFTTSFLNVAIERKNSVPVNQRVNNLNYKRLATQVEFMERMVAVMERTRVAHMDYQALAETIANKIDKYKLAEIKTAHPKQIEEIKWIKEIMVKTKDMEDIV